VHPITRWAFLTIPLFAIAVVLLAMAIRSLVRLTRDAPVASLPVRDEQTVELSPGDYDLNIEGRIGTSDFAGLGYALEDASGGAVALRPVLMRARVNTFSRARLQLRTFSIGQAGRYRLRVTGLRGTESPENRLVIGRGARGALVARIVAIVILGVLTIGSFVGTILLIVLPRRAGGL
jgi:hypothetical protein